MGEATYEELILDRIYFDGRVSKAKLIGVLLALLIFVGDLIFIIPHSLRMGALQFFITMIFCFFQMVLYYGFCRADGYLVRILTN